VALPASAVVRALPRPPACPDRPGEPHAGRGAGGDALWLAGRGWRVTAVDISANAVRRLAENAQARDLHPLIARALAMDPPLMLFDEPTSALDPELVGEVLDVMRQLAHTGRTMMVVTHEIGFAREVADRIVFMADGVIVEDGPAHEVIGVPREERTRQFLTAVIHRPSEEETCVIYAELGFDPELGRGLFVLPRSVGILAHAWEERGSGRRIKGPIPPPLLPTYTGAEPREP
jgi:hypothetical protein